MQESSRKKIFAISIFVASLLLSSCSSLIKSESNTTKTSSEENQIKYIPASKDDMFLYRQIGISYLCMARQIDVEFPKAITLAAKNYASIISGRHGGLIEKLGTEKLPDKNIYNGAVLEILEGAIQNCPAMVPEKEKTAFLNTIEKLSTTK